MSRICELCGKKGHFGQQITRRGLAKKKGGIGLKTTGVSRRQFKPNIQRVRALVDGKVKKVKVCTSCLKTKIRKPLLVKPNV